jgi:cyanate lyase
MFMSHNNVDVAQRTAAPTLDDDPMHDPLMKALKRIVPYHEVWSDPVKTKEFHDGLLSALNMGTDEGKGASPQEVARVRQARPDDPDHKYLDNPEEWNRARRNHEF